MNDFEHGQRVLITGPQGTFTGAVVEAHTDNGLVSVRLDSHGGRTIRSEAQYVVAVDAGSALNLPPVADPQALAARIISGARTAYSRNNPQDFDFHTAVEGVERYGELWNQCQVLARGQMRPLPAGSDHSARARRLTENRDRTQHMWDAILPELEAYASRCKATRFTGWSRMSR